MAQKAYQNRPLEQNTDGFGFSPEEMHPLEVANALSSDLEMGLDKKQKKRAAHRFGPNDITPEFRLSFRDSLKNQSKGLMGLFLMSSSLLMFLWKGGAEYLCMMLASAGIMFLNAFAEYRASRALRLPKKYSALKSSVVSGGEVHTVDSRTLVPGDVIFLEQGSMVPADCRLVDDDGLAVLETHVSGSAESVFKDSGYIASSPEAVSRNMVYAGSIVVSGNALALVCYTGRDTLFRRGRGDETAKLPKLLLYVKKLCSVLSVISVASVMLLLGVSVAAGADVTEIFVCSLAIGASSMCESMLSLCSSSFGFGIKAMAQDGMVVRNYDRIGTLAEIDTVMCGKNLAFPPKRIGLTGMFFSGSAYDRKKRPDDGARELLTLILVCSDARKVTQAEKKQRHGLPEYEGGPLENAVVDYFEEWNQPIGNIREKYIRMDAEYTLSGEVSRLLALHNGKNTVILRGSPENVLSRCVGYTLDGTDYKLSDFTRKKILASVQDFARTNSFLVGVACGETQADCLRDLDSEDRLIFKGFVSFSSSLDPGVASSVYRCNGAGIETVINSDDAYYTAMNAAKNAGIIDSEAQIISGEVIKNTDRGLYIANSPYYKLYLNLSDDQWLDAVTVRKDNGRTVAVTGERLEDLHIMREADVSVVPEETCDTLRRTADTLLLGKGINLIADGILNAKTICRRIYSVASYLICGALMLMTAELFSVLYDGTPAFRVQDIMFGGLIFNLCFGVALAFSPRSPKTLREHFDDRKTPKLTDFIYPLMFSVGGGFLLFFCSAATESYTCTLVALTLTLFLYACTTTDHGGVLRTKRFGSSLLYLCGLFAAAVLACLMFTSPGHVWFGYGVPSAQKMVLTLVLSAAYCVLSQILRYFISPRGKHKKRKEKLQ